MNDFNFHKADHNDVSWYLKTIHVEIDRVSVLNLVGAIELVVRHPGIPKSVRASLLNIGTGLANKLRSDGIVLPPEVEKSWNETFPLG